MKSITATPAIQSAILAAHLGVGEVELPEHVAVSLLSVSAGAERIPDDPIRHLRTNRPTGGHGFEGS